MKRLVSLAAAAIVLVGSVVAIQPAYAARVGIAIGVPLYGPGFYGPGVYGYPYYGYPYYPPAVVAVPAAPTTYIEQQPTAAAASTQADSGYWYYCKDPAGYYPTVNACPAGWQKVAPLPAH